MDQRAEETAKQLVSDFLCRNNGERSGEHHPFALPKEVEKQLLICLEQLFGQALSTGARSIAAARCTQLYQCLGRLLHAKTKQKEGKCIPSLHICCAILTLLDFDISPEESMSVLASHFDVSVFDAFRMAKHLSFERSCKDLMQCLEDIIVNIVQRLLWKPNSTLWNKMSCNEVKIPLYGNVKEYQQSLKQSRYKDNQGKASEPDKALGTDQTTKNNADPDALGTDQTTKNNADLLSSTILLVFQDIYGYTFKRLEALCEILSTSDHIQEMWTTFNHIMAKHCQEILYDRHLDQIILCIVYAVCKAKIPVSPPEFKMITRCYVTLPQSDPNVPTNVSLAESGETHLNDSGNIVKFYNKIFLPPLKQFIRSNGTMGRNCSLTKNSPIPTCRDSSVCVSGNVYVSPLRTGIASPQRSMEYKFSRSPSSQLQNINKMLKNSPISKRDSSNEETLPPTKAKRLSFQSDECSSKLNTSLLR